MLRHVPTGYCMICRLTLTVRMLFIFFTFYFFLLTFFIFQSSEFGPDDFLDDDDLFTHYGDKKGGIKFNCPKKNKHSPVPASIGNHGSAGKNADMVEDFVEINIASNKSIHLPHILVHWTDGELNPRCTLYMWMLSGLQPRDISAKVLEGGEVLRVTLPWPDPLHDAMRMNGQNICDDSVKIVNMEKVIKGLKGGSFERTIYSVVDVDLGMKVEEQLHNEPIGKGQVEKGNKVLRFANKVYNHKMNRAENVPILVTKYEMMGHKDSYRTISTADSDYEDEYETVCSQFSRMAPPSAPGRDQLKPPSLKKRRTDKGGKKSSSGGKGAVANLKSVGEGKKAMSNKARFATGGGEQSFHTPTNREQEGNKTSFPFNAAPKSMDLERAAKELITQKGGRYLKSFLFGKASEEKMVNAVDELICNVSKASNSDDDEDYVAAGEEYTFIHSSPQEGPAFYKSAEDEEMYDNNL